MGMATRTSETHPSKEGKKQVEQARSWNFFRYVSDQGLVNFRDFKYEAGTYTPLDLLMNPFWAAFARQLPRSVSPNLVTVTALTTLLVSVLPIICIYDFQAVPTAYFVFGAMAIFAYQTLDAADGKHARNTGQMTPLGSLVDHGCDGVAMVFIALLLQMASHPKLPSEGVYVWGFLLPQICFHAAQWEFFHTKKLEHGGATEGILLAIGMLLMCTFLGSDRLISDTFLSSCGAAVGAEGVFERFGLASMSVSMLLNWVSVVVNGPIICGNIFRVVRRFGVQATVSLLPCAIISAAVVFLLSSSATTDHGLLVRLVGGTAFALVNVHIIIVGLCSEKSFPTFPWYMTPLAILAVVAACEVPLDYVTLLLSVLIVHIVVFLGVCGDTVQRLCAFLDVPFLSPVPKCAK